MQTKAEREESKASAMDVLNLKLKMEPGDNSAADDSSADLKSELEASSETVSNAKIIDYHSVSINGDFYSLTQVVFIHHFEI